MEHKRSAALFQEAKTMMPGGVSSPVRAFRSVGGEPLFISRAEGSRLYDVDENSYIDYIGSWGPAILGHAHPKVLAAIQEYLPRGLSFGAPNPLEVELARRVRAIYPSMEKLRFVTSGTEAAMSAARLARAATGRAGIVKIDGGYHGHADIFLVQAGSGATTFGHPDSAGIPKSSVKDTYSIAYNSIEVLEQLFAEKGSEIAALMLEPVAGNMGLVAPKPGYLEFCREITKKYGALLIFDEVMCGFRVARGGAQERYGVIPDVTALGKVIGGGMPVAAYGGRADLMAHVAPDGAMYQAGTLSGHPLGMAAGIATLDELGAAGVYEQLEERASLLTSGLRRVADAARVPMQISHVGSMIGAFFSGEEVVDYQSAKKSDTKRFGAFFWGMLSRGIYLAPSQFEAWFLSLAHSAYDIEATVQAASETLQEIAAK
jgi:glutamate-1-semialdehyde 2,1-aminomutase